MSEYESDLSQLVYELNRSLPAAKSDASDKARASASKRRARSILCWRRPRSEMPRTSSWWLDRE